MAAEPDRERDAPAIEHARQHVLAEIVGAQRMRQDGPCSLAVKSISLIGTRHSSGPSSDASTISSSTTAARHGEPVPAEAPPRLERRREALRLARLDGDGDRTPAAGASAESDTGVEPAIEDIGDEVEEDDEAGEHEGDAHHDRRVVGEDRGDQQRADAGHAEDLLGDDGAAEHAGICSATSVTTGISALRTTCLMMTLRSPMPLERAVVT